jgi:inosine-uridine nucleoside N-ribohydrolase
MVPRPLVLDCDPGHDDALAILLAAASPSLDLRAITTVAGNQTLAKTTLNARRVCSVAGITSVPVAAGCERPLARDQVVAADIHGESGLDGPAFADPTVELDPRHAVELIIDESRATADLTLVAVGPLTNVATALQRDPALASRLRQIVIMGGAIGLGNTTPAAEFNIRVDPEAARLVFDSGVPITMIPLEVTHRATADEETLERIAGLGTPLARMSVELLRFFAETYERVFGFPHPPVHDPCAVAWLVDPAIVATRHMNVSIETRSELCDGRTVCDLHGVTGRQPNASVGLDLDVERFWNLMLDALARYPTSAGG